MQKTAVAPLDPLKSNRRLRSRARLGIAARLVLTSGPVDCRIENLSVGGARLFAASTPKPGTPAILKFHEFEIFGEVVWLSRECTGFRFDEPLDDQHVIRMRHLAPQILRSERNHVERFAQLWVDGDA